MGRYGQTQYNECTVQGAPKLPVFFETLCLSQFQKYEDKRCNKVYFRHSQSLAEIISRYYAKTKPLNRTLQSRPGFLAHSVAYILHILVFQIGVFNALHNRKTRLLVLMANASKGNLKRSPHAHYRQFCTYFSLKFRAFWPSDNWEGVWPYIPAPNLCVLVPEIAGSLTDMTFGLIFFLLILNIFITLLMGRLPIRRDMGHSRHLKLLLRKTPRFPQHRCWAMTLQQ